MPTIHTLREIKKIIKDEYALEIIKAKKLKLGTINLTYLVETKDNKYVFRIYKRNKNIKQIKLEHKLLLYLERKNFPVAKIIFTVSNKTFSKRKEIIFTLFQFIPGKIINKPNLKQLKNIAEILGLYHRLIFKSHIKISKSWWFVEDIPLERYFNQLNKSGISKLILQQLGMNIKIFRLKTRKKVMRTMPHLIIHGDLSSRNLKFFGSRITGIFDWDNVRRELRILDLVRPLQFAAGVGKKCNKHRIKLFLKFYQSASKLNLSQIEKTYLIEMFRIQHLKEALWQTQQYTRFRKNINKKLLKKELAFLNWLNINYQKINEYIYKNINQWQDIKFIL